MKVLEVKNLSRSYKKKNQKIEALQPVDLSVAAGEILGIVGESGSGKSTLLKQIAGIEKPDTGEILLAGRPVEQQKARNRREQYRHMQMIFQNASGSFNPRRRILTSMEENLKFLAGIRDHEQQMERIRYYMEKTGLEPELAQRYPWELSGGQCQRAAIARALMVEPQLLLCDEITSALDVIVQDRIASLIRSLTDEFQVAVLFVSHDIALVGSLCDRIMVMRDGVCVESGDAVQVLEQPKSVYTKQLLASMLPVEG